MMYINVTAPGEAVPSNFSLESYLLQKLGPQHMGPVGSVVLTLVYSVIFITGTVGNVCTCIVIARNSYMQTTTNYYLFSLAVSDLLLLLFGLPPELYAIWESYPWRFGEAFCMLRQSVLEMTSYASVLTITAFTVERYVAICRPLQAHRLAGLSRCLRIIVTIWIVSVIVALPYSIHTRLFHELHHPYTQQPIPQSLICNIRPEWRARMTYMFQVSTFLFFFTPVVVIICLYILIGIALMRSALDRGPSDEDKIGRAKSRVPSQPRKVVIRMLVAVTVAFILCWAPFHAQRLMVLYVSHWTPLLMEVQSTLFYISGVLYFVSSTVNPILYNVISRRYRIAFRETICVCCQQSGGSYTYNSSVFKGQLDRGVKHPMVVVNRETDCHRVTAPSSLFNQSANNGNVPETLTVRLIDDGMDRTDRSDTNNRGEIIGDRGVDIIQNVSTCPTCETNGYIAPSTSCVLKNGYPELRTTLLNGAFVQPGTVL